jgi:hypothetical protein
LYRGYPKYKLDSEEVWMLRPFAVASIFATVCTCYSQQVTVLPSTIPGIAVIGPQSPDFAASVAQVVGAGQPSNFIAWLPYGVVVKNNSSQALAAITVAWTEARDAASPLHGAQLNYRSQFNGSHLVQSGQAEIDMPNQRLLAPDGLSGFAEGRGLANLPNFQQAQRVQIVVDAVVFASGQFVGADTYGEYEHYQADIGAPRSIADKVLEMRATSPISDILAWLQSLASQQQQRGADITTQRTAGAARQMLGIYSRKGENGLYSMAQSVVQEPAFPLHR